MTKPLTRSMTFAQFETVIGASQLRKGERITITDFTTRHFITDGLSTQALDEGVPAEVTGTTEQLTVLATSANTIDIVAKSTLFPNDIIHYDWNSANWMNNINFVTGETPTLITGFKGVITYREDTIQNNSAGFDFRNCKNRLWSIDQPEWSDTPGTYDAGEFVKLTGGETIIYVSIDSCVSTDVPGVAADKWLALWNITSSKYWSFDSTGFVSNISYTIPADASDYVDLPTFVSYEKTNNVSVGKGLIDLTTLMN